MSTSRIGGRTRSKRAPANAALKTAKSKTAKSKTAKAVEPTKSAKAKQAVKAAKASKPANAKSEASFEKISALCLALPGTKLTMTWGSPHFRVGEKIFCGFGAEDGRQVMGVKLRLEHARRRIQEPRFWPSPYVGKHGWVSMDVTQRASWNEVAALIRESYELIAPKALLAKLR